MSPCDTCRKPGSCCKGFVLSPIFSAETWEQEAPLNLASHGVPYFRIVEAVRSTQVDGAVAVRCSCDRLDENGRCSDYDNRPNVCRLYDPLSDSLCCEFVGPSPHPYPEHFAYPGEAGVTA